MFLPRVAPVGADAALVTYIAEVEIPGTDPPAHAQFAVGEVWVKQRGESNQVCPMFVEKSSAFSA